MDPIRPFQDTLVTAPGSGTGFHVLTALPSLARTSSTASRSGASPDTLNENVTARRASTNALVRLVPVSICGALGTGLSSVLGSGGGGGRIAMDFVGNERTDRLTTAASGPVTAPSGTFTLRRVEPPGRTGAEVSSERP